MFKFSLSPTLVRSSTAVTYLTTPAKELLSLSIVACIFWVKKIVSGTLAKYFEGQLTLFAWK